MKVEFAITGRLPGLNDYIREMNRDRHCGNKLKQDNQSMVCWEIAAAGINGKTFDKPVTITYHFYEPNRKRDKSNVSAFARKVIEDALQAMKVIRNDNWQGVRAYVDEFDVDTRNPRIVVTVDDEE